MLQELSETVVTERPARTLRFWLALQVVDYANHFCSVIIGIS